MEGMAIRKWSARFSCGTGVVSVEAEKSAAPRDEPDFEGNMRVLLGFTMVCILSALLRTPFRGESKKEKPGLLPGLFL